MVLQLLEGVWGALLNLVGAGSSCLALGMLLCCQWQPRKALSFVSACFVPVCPL